MRRFLLIALCLPAIAAAQGVRFDQYNMTSSNAVPFGAQAPIYTLPNSTVTVCAYPDDGGQPCTNTIPIYSDPALTQLADNAITADVHGRFGFWLAPGTYTYSVVTQGGVFVGTYIFTLGGTGGGGGSPAPPRFSVQFNDPLGTFAGSAQFVTDSQGNVQINGGTNGSGTFELNSAFDDGNWLWWESHLTLHSHGANGGTGGIDLFVDDSHYTGSATGLVPLYINCDVKRANKNCIGIEVQTSLEASGGHYVGVESDRPTFGVFTAASSDRYFAGASGQGEATEEIGYLVESQISPTSSGYCDFMGRNSGGSGIRFQAGCGTDFHSLFGGPVNVQGKLQLGNASQGGTVDSLEGPAASTSSGHDVLYADSATHCLKYSANGGTFHCITASINFPIDTSAVPSISSGSCTNLSVSPIADIDSTTALSLSLAGPTTNVNAAAAALTWNVYYDTTLSQVGYTFRNRSGSTWTNPGTLSVNIGRLH